MGNNGHLAIQSGERSSFCKIEDAFYLLKYLQWGQLLAKNIGELTFLTAHTLPLPCYVYASLQPCRIRTTHIWSWSFLLRFIACTNLHYLALKFRRFSKNLNSSAIVFKLLHEKSGKHFSSFNEFFNEV